MSNTKISQLSPGAPAQSTDLIPIDRAGANYSLQVSDMQTALNGAAIPASKTIVGTNGSSQIVDASAATLSNNTSGTAANLSGTPALPNGTTATTQSALDASTKVATDAYADAAVAVEVARAESAESLLAPKASPAFTGSPTITGGLATVQLATPSAPVITQGGTPASTHYTYAVVAKDANGGGSIASSTTQTTTGAATLNGTNYNIITWSAITGAASYDVYRTASSGTPSTTGLLANTAALTYNDQGAAGNSNATPTINSSGTIKQTGVTNGGGYFISANTGMLTVGAGALPATNAVGVVMFTLQVGMLIGHCTVVNATAQSGKIAVLGIYDVNGNKLIDTGSFSLTTAAPTSLTNSFTQVYLPAGTYYFAVATDSNSVNSLDVFTNVSQWQSLLENTFVLKMGTAANAMSSGVLPQTLGAITKAAVNIVMCAWEF